MQARASGILLPVFSLPGPYGIGTLGAPARSFIDFLAQAGQKFWQILPLVPPGGGDSPYMSPSSFAGNPFFLDLEELTREGLLTQKELDAARRADPDRVDYAWLHQTRIPLLRRAWERGRVCYAQPLAEFMVEEADWLPDYALFLALRERFGGKELKDWPDEIRLRHPSALARYRAELADECAFHAFLQLLFFRQWTAVKAYANGKGISIIGDLPIYVSPDSAEVWSRPELFQLKEDMTPSGVAGVPPDAFSDKGQHWGNPLYGWDYHRQTGFAWWRHRAAHLARLYDVVRIDHFRAFHTYWCIPDGASDARGGHWEPGPGMELVKALRSVPGLALIAEDLGDLDADALRFIADSGLPGMKVLVYAFDPAGESAYLPHNTLARQLTAVMEWELAPMLGESMSLANIDRALEELSSQFSSLLAEASANPAEDYTGRFRELSESTARLKERKAQLEGACQEQGRLQNRLLVVSAAMEHMTAAMTEWDEEVIHQLLEKVTVLSREKIRVTFRDGREIEQAVNQPKRRCITA